MVTPLGDRLDLVCTRHDGWLLVVRPTSVVCLITFSFAPFHLSTLVIIFTTFHQDAATTF